MIRFCLRSFISSRRHTVGSLEYTWRIFRTQHTMRDGKVHDHEAVALIDSHRDSGNFSVAKLVRVTSQPKLLNLCQIVCLDSAWCQNEAATRNDGAEIRTNAGGGEGSVSDECKCVGSPGRTRLFLAWRSLSASSASSSLGHLTHQQRRNSIPSST